MQTDHKGTALPLLPKISIVTPSFNQGRYLEQTMRSVLEQRYENLEYIVVDGGSTDESAQIIRRYEGQLAYWCSQPDGGQADAIARGFERSTGEILGWLNSDDAYLPGALRSVGQFFADHPESEAVSAGAYKIDENGRPWAGNRVPYTLGVASSFNRFRFFPQEGVYQQATFFRRSAYEAAGGLDRGLQFIMDLDLFVRLAARKRFGRLPRLIAAFRMHGASKTSTLSKVWKAELNIFQQRYIRSRRVAVAGRALRLWYKTLYFGYRCLLLGLLRTGVVKLKAVEL